MMSNNQRLYYARYRQEDIAEYSEAVKTYRENNLNEINAYHRNVKKIFTRMRTFLGVGEWQQARYWSPLAKS